MSDGEWLRTCSALSKLEDLLRCPLCRQVPVDPCSLKDCCHHFCRKCIYSGLDGSTSSVCPKCALPVWIKDVTNNRQLENLVRYVDDLEKLIGSAQQGCEVQPLLVNVASAPLNTENGVLQKESGLNSLTGSPVPATNMQQVAADSATRWDHDELSEEAIHESTDNAVGDPPCRKRVHSHSDSDCANHGKRKRYQLSLDAFVRPTVQEEEFLKKQLDIPQVPVTSATAKALKRNIRGETPLHVAAIKGDYSGLQQLLKQGADPNIKDNAGWTALHESCNHGHPELVALLLEYGALINIPGLENVTPLHDAVANSHFEVAALLLANGADANLRNSGGLTAADIAVTPEMKGVLHCASNGEPSSDVNSSIRPLAVRSTSKPCSRVVILGTGLKNHHKVLLKEASRLLGAKIVTSFSNEVSHIVASCDRSNYCSRTFKFLCGIAGGKWIVNAKWVSQCLQENCWVDEAPFEVEGVTVGESSAIIEGPRKARMNAQKQAPGLFDGCDIFLTGDFEESGVSKEELSLLLKLAGGTVLNRAPRQHRQAFPFHLKVVSRCLNTFIVSNSGHSEPQIPACAVVSASWILDCLSHFEIQNVF